MELKYKPDFDRAKLYWRAFWEKEIIDRPVVCVTAPIEGKKPGSGRGKHLYLQNLESSEDYQRAMENIEESISRTYYGGEAIPFAKTTFGPDQFAGFLGGELVMEPKGNTSWVKKFINDWEGLEIKLHEEKGSYFERYLDFSRFFTKYSEGKFLQGMADLHGNMDFLSAARGTTELCFDVIDYPDEVEKALSEVMELYPVIADRLHQTMNVKNRGSIGFQPLYSEKRFAVVQCDFSCMLSPEMGKKYVVPAIQREAAHLDHCIYHYDGAGALVHLKEILAIPEIDAIQWCPGAGQPRTIEWMDLLKKIQKAGKGLWIYDWTMDEIKQNHKELRPEGLVFSVHAKTPAEADEFIDWMKEHI